MALDLGLTTYQLLSALDGLAPNIQSRRRRLDDAIDRALAVPAGEEAFRTAAVGRRPYISARTGPEGCWAAVRRRTFPQTGPRCPWTAPTSTWTATCPCAATSSTWAAAPSPTVRTMAANCSTNPPWPWTTPTCTSVPPTEQSGETLISGPLLGALRTVREVERLADAVENLPDDKPALALLDGTLAFWDLQRGNYPRYVADVLIAERLQPALARLRAASTNRRPVAVAAYTSRPRTTEVAGGAGFDDRELFELVLEPGHRSPLYWSSHLAARFALGLATGQEWSHFYDLNGGAEIARVEVPDWLTDDPELLALSHTMLVKQCELGLGYPVAISEAHEQAVITGHDREEFRRLTLMLLERQGLPTPESAKNVSKRRPWV